VASLIDSPAFGVLIASAVTVTSGLGGMTYRLISKVNSLSAKLDDMAEDFKNAKDDKDIVRWSTLAGARIRRRRRGW
jgi:hypothetical protein